MCRSPGSWYDGFLRFNLEGIISKDPPPGFLFPHFKACQLGPFNSLWKKKNG